MIDCTDKRVLGYLHSKRLYGEGWVFWPANVIAAVLELPQTQVDASLESLCELGWIKEEAQWGIRGAIPSYCITEAGINAHPFYGA